MLARALLLGEPESRLVQRCPRDALPDSFQTSRSISGDTLWCHPLRMEAPAPLPTPAASSLPRELNRRSLPRVDFPLPCAVYQHSQRLRQGARRSFPHSRSLARTNLQQCAATILRGRVHQSPRLQDCFQHPRRLCISKPSHPKSRSRCPAPRYHESSSVAARSNAAVNTPGGQ